MREQTAAAKLFKYGSAIALSICLLSSSNCLAKQTSTKSSKAANTTNLSAKANPNQSPTAIKKTVSNQPKPGAKEFLWKLTTDSGATLFLLGTMHLVKPDFYPLPAEMEKAFEKSKALILELDLTKQDPSKTQGLIQQLGLYPGTELLTHHISAFTANELMQYCDKNKIPFASLVRFKPWLAAVSIMQIELQRLGYNTKDGIDLHFCAEAKAAGKKVIGLESEEFQLGLFAGLPLELQDKMLSLTLLDMSLLPVDAGKLMKAWKDGDDVALDEVSTKDVREHPEFAPVNEKILYERNVTMVEKLEPYLKGSDTFMVAVGSGHLSGDRSIIQLLRNKGYKVTQVVSGEKI